MDLLPFHLQGGGQEAIVGREVFGKDRKCLHGLGSGDRLLVCLVYPCKD